MYNISSELQTVKRYALSFLPGGDSSCPLPPWDSRWEARIGLPSLGPLNCSDWFMQALVCNFYFTFVSLQEMEPSSSLNQFINSICCFLWSENLIVLSLVLSLILYKALYERGRQFTRDSRLRWIPNLCVRISNLFAATQIDTKTFRFSFSKHYLLS